MKIALVSAEIVDRDIRYNLSQMKRYAVRLPRAGGGFDLLLLCADFRGKAVS